MLDSNAPRWRSKTIKLRRSIRKVVSSRACVPCGQIMLFWGEAHTTWIRTDSLSSNRAY